MGLLGRSTFKAALRRLPAAREGVTAIEYGLIAGLVAVLIIVGAATIGSSLNNVFQNLATQTAPSGRS